MNLEDLKKPFPATDIEWRLGSSGVKQNGEPWAMALAYITARGIHNRLDEVCSQANWQLRYIEHLGGTICEIGILINQQWVWKAGGAGETEYEAFKGGLSSAEKRAGVPWGIGRYLYNLKETFVNCSLEKKSGWNYQKKNDKKSIPAFWWETPTLPKWALPEGYVEPEIPEQPLEEPILMTQDQLKELRKVSAKNELVEEELEKIVDYFKGAYLDYMDDKGEVNGKLTYAGAQCLIGRFEEVLNDYNGEG